MKKPGPAVFVAVTLRDTPVAVAGMPHCPWIGKSRGTPAASDGGPKGPVKPLPRVSTMRHGVSSTNVLAVTSATPAVNRAPIRIAMISATRFPL
jgi:hypothetical protein